VVTQPISVVLVVTQPVAQLPAWSCTHTTATTTTNVAMDCFALNTGAFLLIVHVREPVSTRPTCTRHLAALAYTLRVTRFASPQALQVEQARLAAQAPLVMRAARKTAKMQADFALLHQRQSRLPFALLLQTCIC